MTLQDTVQQLAAAADPSRLRLLAALLHGEAAVGDLVSVLGQSQPRVSRHLRLLTEAGLVESFREGRCNYYRWAAPALEAGVARSVAAVASGDDLTIHRDRDRLVRLAEQRERDGLRRALRSGRGRGLHLPEGGGDFAEALSATLEGAGLPEPLDALVVNCGSGDVLRCLLPRARIAVGTEPSAPRRQLARARLRRAGVPRWSVRDAAPDQLPFGAGTFDLVVLQDVLPGVRPAEAARILKEAGRLLRPAGRLLLIDRLLPTDAGPASPLAAAGFAITRRRWLPGRSPDRALLLATRHDPSPARTGTHD
jgi:ArsR family transcriptional regulator